MKIFGERIFKEGKSDEEDVRQEKREVCISLKAEFGLVKRTKIEI